MKKFFEEFKAFINRGNVLGLAVGVIIGGAFSNITTSLTNDIIMPIVSIFLGGVDFSAMQIALPNLFGVVSETPNTLNYGNFLNAVINFLVIALTLFIIIRSFNKFNELRTKKEKEAAAAAPAPAPAKSADIILLEEIRDLLKK